MPLGRNVSENMKKLYEENKEKKSHHEKPRKRSQMVAIALSEARKHGADIPEKGKY